MWPLALSLLAASPAVAADPPERWTAAEYQAQSRALARIDARYRAGRTVHVVGNVLAATGLPAFFAGGIVALNDCSLFGGADCRSPVGEAVMVGGLGLYAGGAVASAFGALHAGGAIRRRGGRVAAWPGVVALSLVGVSVALPLVAYGAEPLFDEWEGRFDLQGAAIGTLMLAPAASVVFSAVQMRLDRRATRGLGALTILPAPTARGGMRVALGARF